MTNEATPLPCPFCGGKRVQLVTGSTFRWRALACADCGAQCGEVRAQRDEAMAAAMAAWNTRASPDERERHDERSLLRELRDELVKAWNDRTLPASVVSGDLFQRVDACLADEPEGSQVNAQNLLDDIEGLWSGLACSHYESFDEMRRDFNALTQNRPGSTT